MIDQQKLKQCTDTINSAVDFLVKSGGSPRILCKISNNCGDGIHGQPILRHYRLKHPNAAIAFLTEQRYHNVHEYNTDIDKLFLLPNNLNPQTRLALWDPIKLNKSIDISIIPAINPFQALYKENAWCHQNIADQYLHNAGITDLKPLGGRNIEVKIDDNDKAFANSLNLDRDRTIALEYVSYSTPSKWKINSYQEFVRLAIRHGYKCLSIAGPGEPLISGTIDLRGITWRQTVAVLNKVGHMVGCGSGITMLAAASRPQPKIIELDIPDNVTIDGCGYAPSIQVKDPTPEKVFGLIAS